MLYFTAIITYRKVKFNAFDSGRNGTVIEIALMPSLGSSRSLRARLNAKLLDGDSLSLTTDTAGHRCTNNQYLSAAFYREGISVNTPNEAVRKLLLGTLQRFVATDAQIADFTSAPLSGGMSGSYVQDMLFVRAWRPAWETAVADPRFTATFRDAIPRVEAAAATTVEDMHALLNEPISQTLIHADLNPSNVLVHDDRPYFIDWQTAMHGPFYIDLPHHHCTLT